MLPAHLMTEFWETVRGRLQTHYGLTEHDAVAAIDRFREAIDRHQIGELIYHRDAESVAETVAGAWKHGLSDPITGISA